MHKLRSIAEDSNYYHEAFGLYHRLARRNEVFNRWLSAELPEIFKEPNLQVTGKNPVRVLSIGPGEGGYHAYAVKPVFLPPW